MNSASNDCHIETDEERREQTKLMLDIIAAICAASGCRPLELAESVGYKLFGSGVIN
jgi:hypothetical protein